MDILTKDERARVIEANELLDEIEARYKANGLKYFVPTGRQEEFIRGIGKGGILIGIFSGGNRAGKTETNINILGNIIWGPQNKWFQHSIFQSWPFRRRARVCSNPKDLEEVGSIETAIKALWPKGKYTADKKGKTYNSLYKPDNGWVVDVMSYQQEVGEYESVGLGLCIFNEPPPQDIFNATVARMEAGGLILIGMTPLGEAAWMFDKLIENKDPKLGKVYIVYADIEDSCKEHGIRGYLEHQNIETILSFYDAEEKAARKSGKPLHLSSRIYQMFSDAVHVIDDRVIPSYWPRIHICDPHDGIPFAMGWMAIDPDTGDCYIYDEFPDEPFESIRNTTLTYPDYATIIRNHESRQDICKRLLDPNFGVKRYGNTGKTPQEELAELGIEFDVDVEDNLEFGHGIVREYLKYDALRPLSSINKPKLFILRRCRNHWVSMLRYGRKPDRTGEQRDNIRLVETYKHFCDVIRYGLVWCHLNGIPTGAANRSVVIERQKKLMKSFGPGGY